MFASRRLALILPLLALACGGTTESSQSPPQAPLAVVGPNQAVASGAAVTLDGSGSVDPTGMALIYHWSQASGPVVVLSESAGARPSFTAPSVAPGQPSAALAFALTVSNAHGTSAPAAQTVTVNPPAAPSSQPPVANAGLSQSVASGASVTLDGSASSDPSGLALAFQWVQVSGPAAALSSGTVQRPTFTAPAVAPGQPAAALAFSLVVASGGGTSTPSTVSVTVNPAPPPPPPVLPPVASAGPDQVVASGSAVTLDGSTSHDPTGLPVSFQWTQASGTPVSLGGAVGAHPTFTAPAVAAGSPATSLVFTLVVTSASGASSPSVVVVTVNPAVPPAIPPPVANAGPNQTVASGATVMLDGSASTDPSALGLAYQWIQSSGVTVTLTGAGSAIPTFTAPAVPSGAAPIALAFKLTVSNASGASAPSTISVTVNPAPPPPPPPPPPPVASAGPDQVVASGAAVTLDGSGSADAAGSALTYQWAQVSGTVVTLSSATAVKPTFTAPTVPAGQVAAALHFSLSVTSANGTSAPAAVTVTVNPQPPSNPPPVANAGPGQAVASGALVTLDGSGSNDPDGQPITHAWTQASGPSVLLSSASAVRPTFNAPTVASGSAAVTLVFSLVVTDANASSSPGSVTITVNPGGTTFPPPPGTPPPAAADPNSPPTGGSGSNRWQMGAAQGLYIVDPARGEPVVQGFVVVTLGSISTGNFIPPTDTVVTLNGVPLLRDPNLNGAYWRVDPAGAQPVVGSGGRIVLVATATDPKGGKVIRRTLVFPCPTDVAVASTPAIGSQLIPAAPPAAPLHLSTTADLTLNVGIAPMIGIFPQATLYGYEPATRALVASGSPQNIAPGSVNLNVPVLGTTAGAYLMDLRWPGQWVIDGESGGFCGLVKRWTYTK